MKIACTAGKRHAVDQQSCTGKQPARIQRHLLHGARTARTSASGGCIRFEHRRQQLRQQRFAGNFEKSRNTGRVADQRQHESSSACGTKIANVGSSSTPGTRHCIDCNTRPARLPRRSGKMECKRTSAAVRNLNRPRHFPAPTSPAPRSRSLRTAGVRTSRRPVRLHARANPATSAAAPL